MAKRKHLDVMSTMRLNDFLEDAIDFADKNPDAIITIRQCTGTDFAPFITLETPDENKRVNEEGEFAQMM